MDLLCCASLSKGLPSPRHLVAGGCRAAKKGFSWNPGFPRTLPTWPVKKLRSALPPLRHRRCAPSPTCTSVKTPANVTANDSEKKSEEQTAHERTFLGKPCNGWGETLEPTVKESLKKAVVKYGEFAQMTYDGMISQNLMDPRYGDAWATEEEFMKRVQHEGGGPAPRHTFLNKQDEEYEVRALLNASAGAYSLVQGSGSARNFMGFMAERKADKGPADEVEVVVAWRGTITQDEWLQNAKAPIVAWNNGFQVAEPPTALERSSFPTLKLGESFALALVSLGAFYLYKASSTEPLKVLEQWVSGGDLLLNVVQILPSLLYDSVVLVAGYSAAFVVVQLLVGWVKAQRGGVAEKVDDGWFLYLLRSWWSTQRRGPRTPGVHYGFKQTYTEAANAADKGEQGRPGPPRLTVFRELNRILEKNKDKKKVRIVTVGHSLGGALARLCAFDLDDVARRGDMAAFEEVYEMYKTDSALKQERPQAASPETVDALLASLEKAPSTQAERRTRAYRHSYMRLIAAEVRKFWQNIGDRDVTVDCVTFAAPRAGDNNFAKRFEPGSHGATRESWRADLWDIVYMLPPLLLGVLLLGKSEGVAVTTGLANVLSSVVGAVLIALFAATAAIRGYSTLKAGFTKPTPSTSVPEPASTSPPRSGSCSLTSVGVVNKGDVVPKVPWGFISMERYWHCGYDLTINALEDASYFRGHPVKLFNVSLGQLPSPLIWFNVEAMGDFHNLEVYLKACDDSRDVALMNKSSGTVDNEKIQLITDKLDDARVEVLEALEYLLVFQLDVARGEATARNQDGAGAGGAEGSGNGNGALEEAAFMCGLEEPSEPDARTQWIMSALQRIVEKEARTAVDKEEKTEGDDDSRFYFVALAQVKRRLAKLMEEQVRRRNASPEPPEMSREAGSTRMLPKEAFDRLLDEPQKKLAEALGDVAKHSESRLERTAKLENVLVTAMACVEQHNLRVVLKCWFRPEIHSGMVEKEERNGVYVYVDGDDVKPKALANTPSSMN